MAMSDEHKGALVQGRAESRSITNYLDALGGRRPGRPVTAESVQQRLAGLDERIASESDPLKRVKLYQTRIDADRQLAAATDQIDLSDLEAGFVEVAKGYSERKGITYGAWREAGVSAAILKKAGIPRTRRG